MNKLTGFFFSLLIGLSLSAGGIQDVEAKRFGGARSFGSKPSYSKPYRRSTANPTRSASQQRAYQKNQAARQSMARRGGLMGMLGGLALGGLLGAMFFGGAFEGLNFMDILVFGGIAYLLYKLFAAKTASSRQPHYSRSGYDSTAEDFSYGQYQDSPSTPRQGNPAGFDTDVLFNRNRPKNDMPDLIDADFNDPAVPDDFDEPAFIAGAKSAFKQLQHAWDRKDVAEIRSLTTDKVFAEIQAQLQADDSVNHTEVLKIDAELLEVREIGSELEAVVLFDTIMREDLHGRAEQVREIWHFTKSKNDMRRTWYLDGIQQLES